VFATQLSVLSRQWLQVLTSKTPTQHVGKKILHHENKAEEGAPRETAEPKPFPVFPSGSD